MQKATGIYSIDNNEIDQWILERLACHFERPLKLTKFSMVTDAIEHFKKGDMKSFSFDSNVILLHIHMPVFSGFDFLTAMSEMDFSDKLKVIVLTAVTHDNDLIKLKHFTNVRDVILKPLTSEKLDKILKRIYSRSFKTN